MLSQHWDPKRILQVDFSQAQEIMKDLQPCCRDSDCLTWCATKEVYRLSDFANGHGALIDRSRFNARLGKQ